MARTKQYLIDEAERLGVELDGNESVAGIMDKLMVVKAPANYIVDQFEPMAAQDAKKFLNYENSEPWVNADMDRHFWNNKNIIAENKLDGVRMKAHLKDGKWRFDSRSRSDVTYVYNEVTANFPQFIEYPYPEELEDTILDGEFLMPVNSIDTRIVDGKGVITEGTLTTTMAVVGSGPDKAIPLQKAYGWCEFHIFDIIKYKGKFVDGIWSERRVLLEKVVERMYTNPYLKLVTPMTISKDVQQLLSSNGVKCVRVESLVKVFENITEAGGEGLMFKKINGKYQIGKRPRDMWKLKKFETAEGFITGYIPGENAFTGLVGSLLISAYLPNGDIFEFAAVSQMTFESRKELTAIDGSLKDEYYDKVIEVKGQERTKTNRFRHAVLYSWRPDRSPESCKYEI